MAMAHTVTSASTFDVTVRAIASGGDGVADLPDGRVVFVPRTAPGDRVRVRLVREKSRWAAGTVESLLEPSAERREPLCSVYDRCGGCQLQHLPYEEQLVWKGRMVADALERIGHVTIEPPEVVPSPDTVRYRNRMSFTLRRLRNGRVVAGLHAIDRPGHIVDLRDECVLPDPRLAEGWSALRAAWGPRARRLPEGGRLRLVVRTLGDGFELVVEGGAAGWRADELMERAPGLQVVRHEPARGDATVRAVDPSAEEAALGTAFVQVNRGAATALEAWVLDRVGSPERDGATLVDAYCGVGNFGRPLAEAGWRVHGVELDGAAIEIARRDAPAGFEVERGRVEGLLATHLPADVLLVNPPRTGLGADVTAIVLTAPPARLVYVSCDPATLARDVAALSERYAVSSVRAFDLFPQTAHVETVLVLDARAEVA